MWQCMLVWMVIFFPGLLCHMLSVVHGKSCDTGMKNPACLQDKRAKPQLPPASPSLSALYFCNWRCHYEINSVVITDFTSCYQFSLEEAATRGRLKIFLFHASSISSLHERWASGCVCCFLLMSLDRDSILPVTRRFFVYSVIPLLPAWGKAILYHTEKQVEIKPQNGRDVSLSKSYLKSRDMHSHVIIFLLCCPSELCINTLDIGAAHSSKCLPLILNVIISHFF